MGGETTAGGGGGGGDGGAGGGEGASGGLGISTTILVSSFFSSGCLLDKESDELAELDVKLVQVHSGDSTLIRSSPGYMGCGWNPPLCGAIICIDGIIICGCCIIIC